MTNASGHSWERWSAERPQGGLLHLDSAAAGRASTATLAAAAAHARLEAEIGAYVAEEQMVDVISTLREHLAEFAGVPAAGVVFLESGTAALDALLRVWPLPPAPRVGVLSTEWGPNLESFVARGMAPLLLPAEPSGRLDLEAFGRLLTSNPPDVVHLVQVASHRALVQPVAEALELCRRHGVPLWVDAAQALGHVRLAAGADATYGTSRKWLNGPRGVGILAIDECHWGDLRLLRRAKYPADLPVLRAMESAEAHVSGRVGLAQAVTEFRAVGAGATAARLEEVGRVTRDVLTGVPGWETVGGADQAGATTSLRPTAGQDVAGTRMRLLSEHRILTTACLPWRAPGDMTEPLLRLSPHVDCTEHDLMRVAEALVAT